MSDRQTVGNRPLLPIYSQSRIIDILCVVLVFIGMLLSAGFFSSSPGSLIVPFCNLMLSWFGTWAVVYSMMMVVVGILLLLLRWVFPKIRMGRGKQILYGVLIIFSLWVGLTLSALYGGAEAGGSLGLTYVKLLTDGRSAGQVSFWLWTLLVLSLCLLAGGTKWMPKLFRAFAGEVKELAGGLKQKSKQLPEKKDPAEFDWKENYTGKEERSLQRRKAGRRKCSCCGTCQKTAGFHTGFLYEEKDNGKYKYYRNRQKNNNFRFKFCKFRGALKQAAAAEPFGYGTGFLRTKRGPFTVYR